MRYKAVLFDLDGTLMDDDAAERAGARAFKRRHGDRIPHPEEGFTDTWHAILNKHALRYDAGEITFEESRRERMRDITGQPLTAVEADAIFAEYLADYEAAWNAYPDTAPSLDRLAGFKLGIVTNWQEAQQRRKLAAVGILDRFPVVVGMEPGKYIKPHAPIFHLACEKLGVLPAECVFVGDHLEKDARGSTAAGMRGIWLNRLGLPPVEGVEMMTSLDELVALLLG